MQRHHEAYCDAQAPPKPEGGLPQCEASAGDDTLAIARYTRSDPLYLASPNQG